VEAIPKTIELPSKMGEGTSIGTPEDSSTGSDTEVDVGLAVSSVDPLSTMTGDDEDSSLSEDDWNNETS